MSLVTQSHSIAESEQHFPFYLQWFNSGCITSLSWLSNLHFSFFLISPVDFVQSFQFPQGS